ncbi:MAG: archaellin/type IV pilin N-terminal domain-containing protein [Thermoprotei archaeon]|nr:hypothetical protein [TACK group archaeon]
MGCDCVCPNKPSGYLSFMRKGLSSVLGTIIVLVLTVTAGAMLWHTFYGLFSSLSQQNQLQIESATYSDTSAGSFLSVTVKNVGTSSLTIQGVSLEGVGKFSWAETVAPGQQASDIWAGPQEPDGSSFLLVVNATSPSGGSAQASQVITVSPRGHRLLGI